jgi:hypothetical protein
MLKAVVYRVILISRLKNRGLERVLVSAIIVIIIFGTWLAVDDAFQLSRCNEPKGPTSISMLTRRCDTKACTKSKEARHHNQSSTIILSATVVTVHKTGTGTALCELCEQHAPLKIRQLGE